MTMSVGSPFMDPARRYETTTQLLLEDDRIAVRPLAASDVDAHLAGCDDVIIERLGGGEPSSRSQMEAWLETNAHAWSSGGDVVDLGIEDLGTGLLCGCVGVQGGLDYLSTGQVNLTYALYPQWRGHGYATRAVRLAMQAAEARRSVVEFVIRAAPDNPESIAVAQRAGFERSGQTHDSHGKLIWLTRQAWAPAHGR